MIVRQFWAKGRAVGRFKSGKNFNAPVWAGSELSSADAKRLLRQRVQERLEAWGQIDHPGASNALREDPTYAMRDINEKLLGRGSMGGAGAWAITRNGYGCRTLCSERMLIADLDSDQLGSGPAGPPSDSGSDRFASLLGCLSPGGKLRHQLRRRDVERWTRALDQARAFAPHAAKDLARMVSLGRVFLAMEARPELSLRVYETTRGFRAIETTRAWRGGDADARELMGDLACDQVYTTLCRKQDCFRARLQAKPWRCGSSRPDWRYPFESVADEEVFAAWLSDFELKASSRRAARFLGVIGSGVATTEFLALCSLHDQESGALDEGKALA